ncbi:MAG: fibro-slime domain-containing protein [Eubacteriales bacterium]|nr:fibro-slime domain-containing protein [Eubacteriales bacterium]
MKIKNLCNRAISFALSLILVFGMVTVGLIATPLTQVEAATTVTTADLSKRAYLDGVYIIRLASNPDYVLSGRMSVGAMTIQKYTPGSEGQMFVVMSNKADVLENSTYGRDYGIRPVNIDWFLATKNSTGATQNETNTQTTTKNLKGENFPQPEAITNQMLWYFEELGNNKFKIRAKSCPEYTLATKTATPTGMTALYDYACSNAKMMEWILEPVCVSKRVSSGTFALKNYYWWSGTNDTIAVNGTYHDGKTAMCMNNSGGRSTEGNYMQLYRADFTHAMYYVIDETSDGYYTLTNRGNGRYIRANDSTGNVELGTYADGTPADNEKWSIIPITCAGSNRYAFVNFKSGLYLGTVGDAITQGTKVNTSKIREDRIGWQGKSIWCLHSELEFAENYQQADLVAYDTDVYASTFDKSNTISLPIKLFDYRADGMLFEYASNESTATTKTHTNGAVYNMGNNLGFGLTFGSNGYNSGNLGSWYGKAIGTNYNSTAGAFGTTGYTNSVLQVNAKNTDVDFSVDKVVKALGYTLFQDQTSGWASVGLMQPALAEDGYPIYSEKTVTYVANMLKQTLMISQKTGNNYNYNHVTGEANFASSNGSTLAMSLRYMLSGNTSPSTALSNVAIGNYAQTHAKRAQLIQPFNDVKAANAINTFMDAAYFLLNSLFLEDSYNNYSNNNVPYTSIVLTSVQNKDGRTGYIFDSAFTDNASAYKGASAVKYNSSDGTIRNTSAAGKSMVYWGNAKDAIAARHSFMPIRTTDGDTSNVYGAQSQTNSPYVFDDGVTSSHTGGTNPEYKNRNYNFILQSEGTFIYHEEKDLFFEFEGDDDVYMFINGQLVLDIGGAHAITATSMDVNDYVDWAWSIKENPSAYSALSEADKARVDAFAIYDGDQVEMKFYYMERHGYGSNMRIFTNIEISSTDIDVEKTAYQDGVQLDYDAIVNTEEPVEYGFTLTNTANHNLFCLTYDDDDIGVTIDYKNGLTVSNTAQVTDKNGEKLDAEDLVITLIMTEGSTVTKIPVDLTLATHGDYQRALRRLLCDVPYAGIENVDVNTRGLPSNWSLEFRGIYYNLSEQDKDNSYFLNVVTGDAWSGIIVDQEYDSTGVIDPDDVSPSGENIYDKDDMRVRMPLEPVYYMWRGHQLQITKDKLFTDLKEAMNSSGEYIYPEFTSLDSSAVTAVTITNSSGRPTAFNGVSVSGTTLKCDYSVVGSYTFYVTLTYSGSNTTVVPVQVFVLDVQDEVFVLDYGLSANLTEDGEVFADDNVTVDSRSTEYRMLGISESTPEYTVGTNNITFATDSDNTIDRGKDADDKNNLGFGEYKLDDGVLTYTPSEFMEGADTIWSAVRVSEDMDTTQAIGNVDINKEVEMFKSVTVVPANVVYYEDCFADIDYTGATTSNTIEVLGTLSDSVSMNQSINQDMNYGFDDGAYAADQNVELSHGICTKIPIVDADNNPSTREVSATFTFKGTGFELISRTNALDSATIVIDLIYPDETVKHIPVITEFDHGADGGNEEIYQVPVIRIEGLDYGEYTVNVVGVPSYDWSGSTMGNIRTTYLYVDGVRIYNPIKGSKEENYYGDEKGSKFTELRDLILMGQGVAASYTANESINLSYADIYVSEDRNKNDKYTSNVGGLDQLNIVGPNNEVYINATSSDYAVVLYVKPASTGTPVLQIGVHDVDEKAFYGVTNGQNEFSSMRVGVDNDGKFAWTEQVKITSGTEQYYNIDITKCPVVDGYYQVVIDVDGFISFTNVKHNNVEFKTLQEYEANTVITYLDNKLAIFDCNGNKIEITDPDKYLNIAALTTQLDAEDTLSTNAVSKRDSIN